MNLNKLAVTAQEAVQNAMGVASDSDSAMVEPLHLLKALLDAVGRERLVLDLSCRRRDDGYYIVTDRWQKFTEERICAKLMDELCRYCDEFLVHAVDVEGKANGIETELAALLGAWGKIPVTYAGGVGSFHDLKQLKQLGRNRLNVTIGSALDIFGGTMEFEKVLAYIRE